MRRLFERLRAIAVSPVAVLITGETGSGKEILARAIHDGSRRAARAWVDFNCAAIPESLLESELFGYEAGAFSGAGRAKPGLFELAQGGTLFLDEIGELPPRIQSKLLRVLDGMPYYRLGGTRKIAVDTRIVAATNQDLAAAIRGGAFRADLYYRLAQVRLEAPPLRERPEDIEPMARAFLAQVDAGLRLSSKALDELRAHHWPGNVRELRNTMAAAAFRAIQGVVEPVSLAGLLPERAPVAQGSLADLERAAIADALAAARGNRSLAARRLGISRRTINRKLKQYEAPAGPGGAAGDLAALNRALADGRSSTRLTIG